MISTQHSPQPVHEQFGQLIASHRCNMTPVYVFGGVAVVCLLAGAMAFWLGYSRYHAPPSILDEMSFGESARKSALMNGSIIGAINSLIAVMCIPAAMFQMSVKTDLYERRLVVCRGRKRHAIPWAEVAEVNLRRDETVTFGSNSRRRVVRYVVDVKKQDGNVVELRGLRDMGQVALSIARMAGLEVGRTSTQGLKHERPHD